MKSPLGAVVTSKFTLAVLLLLLASPPPACHANENITTILAGHPELSEFSSLLASTGLTMDIMLRTDQLTVLAVGNDDIAPLRSMPREAIRQHLSLHVLLGYHGTEMLGRLRPRQTEDLSTLFQPSGDAPRRTGIVEVSGPDPDDHDDRRVSFVPTGPASGSGVWRHAYFVKSVFEEPDMVVLQVSATMSAPWLPGSPARRDGAGGDAAAVDAAGAGAKN